MVAPTMGILLMFALNSVGGLCPPMTKSLKDFEIRAPEAGSEFSCQAIHCTIRFFTRFFFDCAGAKKKLSKRNAKGKTRKKGLFEKSPL